MVWLRDIGSSRPSACSLGLSKEQASEGDRMTEILMEGGVCVVTNHCEEIHTYMQGEERWQGQIIKYESVGLERVVRERCGSLGSCCIGCQRT